jgi:hypothetical protein
MEKPSVYLDTSIISAYWYEGADVASFARRLKTREWWELESRRFDIWTSNVSEDELRAGRFPRQADCLSMVRRLKYLPITRPANELFQAILEAGVVPASKPRDAIQMALSTAHKMDYLLSWNYAHLANPVAQARLEAICHKRQFRAPMLVSPESIPKVSLGEAIRRPKT